MLYKSGKFDDAQKQALVPLQPEISSDGSGNLEVRASNVNLREVHVMDMNGIVYLSKYGLNSDEVSLTDIPARFSIIVIIDEHGRVSKKC